MLELANRLSQYKVEGLKSRPIASGKLVRVIGLTLEATGCKAPIGSLCLVETMSGQMEAEVVGFSGDNLFLMPSEQITGILPGARVTPMTSESGIPVGMELLGRVIDGVGNPLDGLGPIYTEQRASFNAEPINPLARKPISEPLDVGLKAINGLLTVGKGQRIGLFAGSGVGKSILLGMMTRFTAADVVIVALVGERGREVREFVETTIGVDGMARSIVVAAPADETPVMRLRAGMYASRLAEYYRDRGQRVLLLFDSLTRYAQAQREIALATGEPPATRGYPPSVFAKLPQLVERAGNGKVGGGSVTAFYTVLTEGDDMMDPVADAARAILDGHIVLSRDLADEGIYPAIDVQSSISRAMPAIVERPHLDAANRVKQLYSRYQQSRDLINVGAYTAGIDVLTDQAIAAQPAIREFLQQPLDHRADLATSALDLSRILQQSSAAPVVAQEAEGAIVPAPVSAPGGAQ